MDDKPVRPKSGRKQEDPQIRFAFNKARTFAYWSFVGLLIPIAGIILGIIALSSVGMLSPHTEDERRNIRHVRRFAWWGIGLSIAMAITSAVALFYLFFGGGTASGNGGNGPITVTGTLSLHDTDSFGSLLSGDSCAGSNGYEDITQGAQVVASDGSGTVLAISQLGAGSADGSGDCIFDFTINNVPHENFYQFEVSHRGELDYSYQQLSADNFTIGMTLGN